MRAPQNKAIRNAVEQGPELSAEVHDGMIENRSARTDRSAPACEPGEPPAPSNEAQLRRGAAVGRPENPEAVSESRRYMHPRYPYDRRRDTDVSQA